MSVLVLVLAFITIITLGPFMLLFGYLYFRRRSINNRELQKLKNEIEKIRMDIGEIKERIADFIIKTN